MFIAVSSSLKHTYFLIVLDIAMRLHSGWVPYDLSQHNHCSTPVLIWQIFTGFYFLKKPNARLETSPDSGVNGMDCAVIH